MNKAVFPREPALDRHTVRFGDFRSVLTEGRHLIHAPRLTPKNGCSDNERDSLIRNLPADREVLQKARRE
jgi:hypothetical protein